MSKVLIITKNDLRHHIFLRMASATLGSDWTSTLIQTGLTNDGGPLLDRIVNVARRAKNSMAAALTRQHSPDAYMQSLVGFEPLSTDAVPGLFKTSDPNSPGALAFLRNAAPDLVLIYGASILRSDWLTLPRLGCLNMHYGVLPFYRSSHSTQFALLHERPDLVGATIHYLDAGVDTGSIVRRYSVDPTAHSTVNQVVGAVYAAGARGLLEIARESITTGSRLTAQTEKAAKSYYPGKLGTPAVMASARWRHSELSKPWPYTEQCIEKIALGRLSLFRRRKLLNGVYILLYHSVPDPSNLQPWEKSYSKVSTSRANFAQHIDWLIFEGFSPLPLSEAPEVLRRGGAAHPHFVVTFDDAYTNIAGLADFLGSRKIVPTVFVNGAFCEGRPYFRVLTALLRDHGGGPALRTELASLIPNKEWSEKPDALFDQTKDQYVPGLTETAVAAAYKRAIGVAADLHCHLDAAELLSLRKRGWQIGNHTWEHLTLSALDDATATDAIERNAAYLKDANLDPLDWLSYPNGLARHVSAATKAWLDRNPTAHGLFAGGGVNLFYSRTQWLRIPLGNPNLRSFRRILAHNVFASAHMATHLTDHTPAMLAR